MPEGATVHRVLHERKDFPVAVGLDGAPLESGAGECLFRLERVSGQARVLPGKGAPLRVNGKEAVDNQPLKSGDTLECGDYKFRFYLRLNNSTLSAGSLLLSRIAIFVIALFVVMELLLMIGLPRMMMARQSMWDKASQRQNMMEKLEHLRRQARKIHAATPFMQAVLLEISQDLDRRVSYVRDNELRMRERSRRKMMSDLVRIEQVLAKLSNEGDLAKIKSPNVDASLKAIIEHGKE